MGDGDSFAWKEERTILGFGNSCREDLGHPLFHLCGQCQAFGPGDKVPSFAARSLAYPRTHLAEASGVGGYGARCPPLRLGGRRSARRDFCGQQGPHASQAPHPPLPFPSPCKELGCDVPPWAEGLALGHTPSATWPTHRERIPSGHVHFFCCSRTVSRHSARS